MSRAITRRLKIKMLVGLCLIFVFTFAGWILESKMEYSIKAKFLRLRSPKEWELIENWNFWKFGSQSMQLRTSQSNYSQWLNDVGKVESIDKSDLKSIPDQVKSLALRLNFKWRKYATEDYSIIYFASPCYDSFQENPRNHEVIFLVVLNSL